MPSMTEHPSVANADKRGVYKGLHVGDSGTGKTGALASLVDAGYKLRILDFDRGLDPVAGYTKQKANLANIEYETLVDEFKLVNAALVIKKAPSFQRAMLLLENWPGLGAVETWDEHSILVIDTLGSMSRASFNMVLQANGILGAQGTKGGPEQSHWGTAMDNVERMLLQMTNPKLVPCHLIVNAHWTFQDDGAGGSKAFPEAIGNKLNPKVARNFNNMLGFSISAGQRKIKVKRDGMTALKTSRPLDKEDYPIETGLADIFRQLVGPPPSVAA